MLPDQLTITDGDLNQPFDVVVVGFGPAGAVAAATLGHAGLRTLVLDKSTTMWQIPRAIAIDHEILRILQNLGVAEQVLPFTASFLTSEHFGVEGQLIRRITAIDPPFPLGYIPTMVFSQPPVEAILRNHVATFRSVSVRLGFEVTSIGQNENGVSVTFAGPDGSVHTAHTRFLLGCDGASSTVRKLMGIRLNDLGFDEPWLVVDIKVDKPALSKLPSTSAQFCNPERPITFIIGPGNHRRWEIMLSPGEDPREMESQTNVWRLLSPWLSPSDGTLWRASSYRFHALVAEHWRKGNVFLAGDAAHQQPPFIGQGMCQGIRDVSNVCWKLKAVLQESADPSLLDTYEQERKRHVHTLTSRIKAIGHHICERDPAAAHLRDESLLRQGDGQAPTTTRQEIVPPLEAGLLSDNQHPANGTLFPQPWIVQTDNPKRLDDLTGSGWRLMVDGRRAKSPSHTHQLGEVHDLIPCTGVVIGGDGLQEQDGVAARWFDSHNAIAALVRPDCYVYGAFESLEELPSALNILRSRLFANSLPVQAARTM